MHFSTVAIIGRYQDHGLDQAICEMATYLKEHDRNVLIETETAKNTKINLYPTASIPEIGQQADLVIVMGGDGTMLGAGRKLAPYNTPLIGINHGRLGFITDIPVHNSITAVGAVLEGQFETEYRSMLEATVMRDGQIMTRDVALNDVVLNRSGRSGMIEISVSFNQQFMYKQRADGVIVATPTGSTAYSLSANGPILHSSVNAFLLVPVAPQTLSNRPIAIPDDGILELTLSEIGRSDSPTSVHFDMQTWSNLKMGDTIIVKKAPFKACFIHPHGYDFFSTLRKKLHWNIMPELESDGCYEDII